MIDDLGYTPSRELSDHVLGALLRASRAATLVRVFDGGR